MNAFFQSLSPQTKEMLRRLQAAGAEAYIVGGCVRDALLGRQPTDIDITTSALPEQIQAIFSDLPTFDTGIRHGTVTVLLDQIPFEVTTYRVDLGYTDGRHPDAVCFTRSLYEDAARRDFTVNAMAYNETDGLRDFFGGVADLKAGLIRCVGQPMKRLTEDALRVLRAVRFASTLGFSIEPETAQALFACAPLLSAISAERITAELEKLLCGQAASHVIVSYASVLNACLPELQRLSATELATAAKVCAQLPASFPLRLAALCFQLPFDDGMAALRRLRLSNRVSQAVRTLLERRSEPLPTERAALRELAGQLGFEPLLDWVHLQAAICSVREDADGVAAAFKAGQLVHRIQADGDCCTLQQLAVNGADLLQRGIRGAAVGQLLQTLLRGVMHDQLPNERSILLNKLDALISGKGTVFYE